MFETKFKKNGLDIAECKECTHQFTDMEASPQCIKEIYSDDYFFNGGAGYEDYTLEKEMLIRRGEYYAKKIRPFITSGDMMDVGAAAGFILKGFQNKGWDGIGIEPNASLVAFGKKDLGLKLIQGTLETVEVDDKFDLISIIQVIAHLYDLETALDRLDNFLKPGGFVLIETWNKDSLTARIFGSAWHEYSPPSTLNYFSKRTLDILMNQGGLSLVASGTPKKSIHSKHAKSLIKHKLGESKALMWMMPLTNLIPGNVVLPYPSEDLFWALYKKKGHDGR